MQASVYITPKGYYHLRVGRVQVPLHRFVWALRYGDPGCLVVHHRNGNKLDNRIENLQAMTNEEHYEIHAVIQRARFTAKKILTKISDLST